jgi:hypothetical protein
MAYVTDEEYLALIHARDAAWEAYHAAHMDPEVGDIVRTKKYAQPLEVLKVNRDRQEVGTRPKGNPLPNITETHKFSEVEPCRKDS